MRPSATNRRRSHLSTLPALALVVLPAALGCAADDPPTERPAATGGAEASAALSESIAFHDPQGEWSSARFELVLEESRPDGTARRTELRFDNGTGRFDLRRRGPERLQEITITGDDVDARLDGSREIPPEVARELRLDPEAALTTRDYYLYLYGLPMKLRDPGTLLDPRVETITLPELGERSVKRLRVTYDPEVGGDTWYFYLDPDTHALLAYRFHHDEAKNDGELILLEGITEVGSMRLPTTRTWSVNEDGRLLGVDTIVEARTL